MAAEERTPKKFQVGDRVRVVSETPGGRTGAVIVIDPNDVSMKYLVNFPDWTEGHDAGSYWGESWYPDEHKTASRSRFWLSDNALELVSPATKSDASGSFMAPTPAVRIGKDPQNTEIIIGDEKKVDTEKSLFGFRGGDIISEGSGTLWDGQRVKIDGVDVSKCLWGTIEGKSSPMNASTPHNIFLLERPGWRFKVGDSVRAVSGPAAGCRGNVIVLNPEKNYLCLVRFETWRDGESTIKDEKMAWFPRRYRGQNRSFNSGCLWLEEHELEKG